MHPITKIRLNDRRTMALASFLLLSLFANHPARANQLQCAVSLEQPELLQSQKITEEFQSILFQPGQAEELREKRLQEFLQNHFAILANQASTLIEMRAEKTGGLATGENATQTRARELCDSLVKDLQKFVNGPVTTWRSRFSGNQQNEADFRNALQEDIRDHHANLIEAQSAIESHSTEIKKNRRAITEHVLKLEQGVHTLSEFAKATDSMPTIDRADLQRSIVRTETTLARSILIMDAKIAGLQQSLELNNIVLDNIANLISNGSLQLTAAQSKTAVDFSPQKKQDQFMAQFEATPKDRRLTMTQTISFETITIEDFFKITQLLPSEARASFVKKHASVIKDRVDKLTPIRLKELTDGLPMTTIFPLLSLSIDKYEVKDILWLLEGKSKSDLEVWQPYLLKRLKDNQDEFTRQVLSCTESLDMAAIKFLLIPLAGAGKTARLTPANRGAWLTKVRELHPDYRDRHGDLTTTYEYDFLYSQTTAAR